MSKIIEERYWTQIETLTCCIDNEGSFPRIDPTLALSLNGEEDHSVCWIIFGAIHYLWIKAKGALQVQKDDNYYMSRLRDTNNQSS